MKIARSPKRVQMLWFVVSLSFVIAATIGTRVGRPICRRSWLRSGTLVVSGGTPRTRSHNPSTRGMVRGCTHIFTASRATWATHGISGPSRRTA